MRWRSGATRRELLCNTALGTAALAAGGIGAYAQPASKPPNIIFILADGPEVGLLRGGCGAVSGSVRMAAQPHGILAVLGVGLMLPASPPLHNRGFIKVSRAGFPVRSVAAMRARRRPARPAAGPPAHRTSAAVGGANHRLGRGGQGPAAAPPRRSRILDGSRGSARPGRHRPRERSRSDPAARAIPSDFRPTERDRGGGGLPF